MSFLIATVFFFTALSTIHCSPIRSEWICSDLRASTVGDILRIPEGEDDKIPVNCYYKDKSLEMSNGRYFFEVEIFNDGHNNLIGVSNETNFANASKTNGLFYNGSLVTGAIQAKNFGQEVDDLDTVGVLVDISASSLKMYVFHNGHPLGLAYDIQQPIPTPLYPSVSIYEDAVLKIAKPASPPFDLQRNQTGISGTWQVETAEENGKIVSNNEWNKFELVIVQKEPRPFPRAHERPDDELEYALQFNVGNTVTSKLKVKNGKFKSSKIRSTKAPVDGEQNKAEILVTSILRNFGSYSENGGKLQFVDTTSSKLTFVRSSKPDFVPVTSNPFK